MSSNLAPSVAKQAWRACSRCYSPATSRIAVRVATHGRRAYVSQTLPANATVHVETAAKADQTAFAKQTGRLPQDVTMPATGLGADTMLSPSAGRLRARMPRSMLRAQAF